MTLWFECQVESLCDCGCDIDVADVAAWLPGGDDADGAVVCLACGEAAEGSAEAVA